MPARSVVSDHLILNISTAFLLAFAHVQTEPPPPEVVEVKRISVGASPLRLLGCFWLFFFE